MVPVSVRGPEPKRDSNPTDQVMRKPNKASRSLPVLEQRAQARREMQQQFGARAMRDLVFVDLDDVIPFGCARSGNCCQGRHERSNHVMPVEFREMYRALLESGEVTSLDQVVPEMVMRAVGVGPRHHLRESGSGRRPSTAELREQVRIGDEGTQFIGLMFRMVPDPAMKDGDRCTFLQIGEDGLPGCRWHATRAQPGPCAIAPVAMMMLESSDEPVFSYPESRLKWCEGMRLARAGKMPGVTLRDLLERNHGDDRIAEFREFQQASVETSSWRRGWRNHHSPLSRLYVREVPELEPLLVGY